jgi:hypothetical protein
MGQQFGLVSNAVDAVDRIRRLGWVGDWRTRSESRQQTRMEESSSRLEPVVIPTRRGAEQLNRVMETLARVELSDGLDLGSLLADTSGRVPADATIIAIVCGVTIETALALGMLRRAGFAVTALVNSHDDEHFVRISGLLLEQGIDSRILRDEESVGGICRDQMKGR